MSKILKPTEEKEINGKLFNVYKSPNNNYIKKLGTNELYEIAYDLIQLKFKYVETNIPIKREVKKDENNPHA